MQHTRIFMFYSLIREKHDCINIERHRSKLVELRPRKRQLLFSSQLSLVEQNSCCCVAEPRDGGGRRFRCNTLTVDLH